MSGILTAGWKENQIKAVLKKAVVTKQSFNWVAVLAGQGLPAPVCKEVLALDKNIPKASIFCRQIIIYPGKLFHINVFTLLKRIYLFKKRSACLEKSA